MSTTSSVGVLEKSHYHVPAPTVQTWQDIRWVGEVSGGATTGDLLSGELLPRDELRSVCRVYAAACGDLAQAVLGGFVPRSADWERWFTDLRTTAHTLSPAHAGGPIVRRALFHGDCLEGEPAPWSHRLRRGFKALLAANVAEPIPTLIGEDVATFTMFDAAWLKRQSGGTDAGFVCSDHLRRSGSAAVQSSSIQMAVLPVERLRPNPLQPRGHLEQTGIQELAASIVAHLCDGGILQPLVLTPQGFVVCGHRRLAAARLVGLVNVLVVVPDLTPVQQLETMIVENLQHQDLSPVELARAYQHLVHAGYTQAAIARAVGTSTGHVASRLMLLRLEAEVLERIHRGELPVGLAPVLPSERFGSSEAPGQPGRTARTERGATGSAGRPGAEQPDRPPS